MASGGIGRLAISLISLPLNLATTLHDAVTEAELVQITGSKRLPNSVYGLKPNNPAFKVLNSAPISVPYHSIIGDRGKGDSPNSTDGVVPYWSSHFDKAQSEVIVPGPDGSTGLPQDGQVRRARSAAAMAWSCAGVGGRLGAAWSVRYR